MMYYPLGMDPKKNHLISFFFPGVMSGNISSRSTGKHREGTKTVCRFDCVCSHLCNQVSHIPLPLPLVCPYLHLLTKPAFCATPGIVFAAAATSLLRSTTTQICWQIIFQEADSRSVYQQQLGNSRWKQDVFFFFFVRMNEVLRWDLIQRQL